VDIFFRMLDRLKLPTLVQGTWRLVNGAARLTAAEIKTAQSLFGPEWASFQRIRIAQGGFLPLVFRLNRQRAFTLFHTINLPTKGAHARANLPLLLHEMVHVVQYEQVGSVYMRQALSAQRKEGYGYDGWEQLVRDRESGKRFRDYNREQQGQIAQDYAELVLRTSSLSTDPSRRAYEPYIEDLRRRDV
jgi:hypothetical protein